MTAILSRPAGSSRSRPQRSLFSRFRLNALSYGYAQLVTLLAQLVLVPFFLSYWGTERYADWLVVTGIPAMLVLLDLGVAQASANRATLLASKQDIKGACRSLQTALVFTLCLDALILASVFVVGPSLDWVGILNLDTLEESQASTILLLMAASLCIHLLGSPLEGWYRTMDRTAIGAFLLANRRMADVLISIAVLVTGGTAVQLAALLLAAQIVILAVLVGIAWRLSPWPVLGFSKASWAEFRSIWKPAIAYAGFPLAQVVTLQGGLQVLNQVASPAVVVGFTMARTMMRLIIQLGVVTNNALKPEISRLAGHGEVSKARSFTLRTTLWVLSLCSSAYLLAIVIGPWVIDWWGNGQVQVARDEIALIGFHALLNVAWFIPAALLIAVNQHISTAGIYGASSVLALIAWAAIRHWVPPLVGASLLLALPELILCIFFFYRIFLSSKKFF